MEVTSGDSDFLRKTEHRADTHLWLPRATAQHAGLLTAEDKALLDRLRQLLPALQAHLQEAPQADASAAVQRHAATPHGSGFIDNESWGSYEVTTPAPTGYLNVTVNGQTYRLVVYKP